MVLYGVSEMRKVDFKAWDTKRKMFTNFMIVDNMFKFMDKVTGVWFRDDEQNRFKLLQNTGFRDNNKIEIYEDDIIEHLDGEYSFTGIVKYSPFGWFVKTDEDNISIEHFADDTSWIADCKVIGNTYEGQRVKEVEE